MDIHTINEMCCHPGKRGYIMPVYNGMLKHIDTDRVRDLASQRGTTDVSTEDIETICDRVVSLATPKSVFYQFYYEPSTHTILCNDPFDVEGATVQSYLDRTEVVIMMASTIGKAVEDEVDALFLQKKFHKGVIMDSAITVATEQVFNQLCGHIDGFGAPEGYKIVWRLSPGMEDFPQRQQADIARAVLGGQIGLSMTETGMIVPRKTITAISGMNRVGGGSSCSAGGCAHCSGCH